MDNATGCLVLYSLMTCVILTEQKMVNGGTVQFWTCLNFSYKLRIVETTTTICNELVNMCVSKGMV